MNVRTAALLSFVIKVAQQQRGVFGFPSFAFVSSTNSRASWISRTSAARVFPMAASVSSITHDPLATTKELDNLTVTVIVDNESDSMSSGIDESNCVDGFQYVSEKQRKVSTGLCSAGHGLSLLLTGTCGSETRTMLLDAGPDTKLWNENVRALGIDVSQIEAIALSHYHWDHAGGLSGATSSILCSNTKGQSTGLLVDLHPAEILQRGRPTASNGVSIHKPENPSSTDLSNLGKAVTVEKHDEAHTVLDDSFYISGYVPRKTEYEKGIPNHVSLIGGKWVLDEEIADERYVACRIKGRGVVVFSSCSHSGIVNVCRDAQEKSGGNHIFGVIGGFHLGGKLVEKRIDRTIRDLKALDPTIVLAGHCTGWRAKAHLALNFPGNYQPLAVGGTYIFSAE